MKNYKVKALRSFTDGLEKINKERYEVLKVKVLLN